MCVDPPQRTTGGERQGRVWKPHDYRRAAAAQLESNHEPGRSELPLTGQQSAAPNAQRPLRAVGQSVRGVPQELLRRAAVPVALGPTRPSHGYPPHWEPFSRSQPAPQGLRLVCINESTTSTQRQRHTYDHLPFGLRVAMHGFAQISLTELLAVEQTWVPQMSECRDYNVVYSVV